MADFPSCPITAVALLIALVALPRGFPHIGEARVERLTISAQLKSVAMKLDIVGAIIVLLATVTLAAGFQEADSKFPWKSGFVISFLVISGLFWIALVLWERKVTLAEGPRQPVLPWRFLTSKAMSGILM